MATSGRLLPLWCWAGIYVLALLFRAGWGTYRLVNLSDPSALEFPDEEDFWRMAGSLWAGEGLEDGLGFKATRMPLYPALLSPFTGLSGGVVWAKVFQWAAGAAAAVLTAGLAANLYGARVGLLAGLLAACDPFLVFFSSLLLTETIFVVGLVGLWWITAPLIVNRESKPVGKTEPRASARAVVQRVYRVATVVLLAALAAPKNARMFTGVCPLPDGRGSVLSGALSFGRWVAVGTVAAMCVYTRASTLGLVALLLVLVVICRRFDGRAVAGAILAGGLVIMALLPWAARNQRVIGEWCWLTTRLGVSLYDGVGPQATGASDLGGIQQMPAVEGMSEPQWNRYFLSESFKEIRSDPVRIIRLAGIKLARTWNPFPNVVSYRSGLIRTISAAWMLPLFIFAFAGAWLLMIRRETHGLRSAVFLLLPAVYLSLLHSLFVGSIRYRLGAIPMLEILAAVAIMTVAERLRASNALLKTH